MSRQRVRCRGNRIREVRRAAQRPLVPIRSTGRFEVLPRQSGDNTSRSSVAMLDFVAGKENVIFLGLSQDPQTLYRNVQVQRLLVAEPCAGSRSVVARRSCNSKPLNALPLNRF
jgi:hypothetical protein